MRRLQRLTLVSALLLIAASVAGVPSLISYQGRLTTSSGQTVSDGAYEVSFALFADSVGGTALWQETATVQTSSGLFSHLLGSVTSFGDGLFVANSTLFLEVVVEGETVGPRGRMSAAAYAQAAGGLKVTDSFDRTVIATDGQLHSLVINGTDEAPRVEIAGDGAGVLELHDDAGDPAISLDAGEIGDQSVQLPPAAINADEILNEPGIVTSVNTEQIPLPTSVMTDLVTVQMTIPAPGFIHLTGKCYVLLSGTTGPNSAIIQIDQSFGGSSDFPYYQQVGLSGYANTGTNYFPVYVERTYFAQAGSYQFRMEGRAQNAPPADAKTWDHIITARYFPTEYGLVTSVLSSPDGFPSAVPINDPRTDSLGQRWKVDLRDAAVESRQR